VPPTIPHEIAATVPVSGVRSSLPLADQPPARELERHERARDRRAARAAVGRQHVAVEVDRPLTQGREVDDAPDRAADEALDLDRAAVLAPARASRCLRSPVDAGSIPYSAVTQPRPWPAIHRGTLSCTDAVQITRVSPCVMSAEPVAVLTKPGSICVGRRSPGPRS